MLRNKNLFGKRKRIKINEKDKPTEDQAENELNRYIVVIEDKNFVWATFMQYACWHNKKALKIFDPIIRSCRENIYRISHSTKIIRRIHLRIG